MVNFIISNSSVLVNLLTANLFAPSSSDKNCCSKASMVIGAPYLRGDEHKARSAIRKQLSEAEILTLQRSNSCTLLYPGM